MKNCLVIALMVLFGFNLKSQNVTYHFKKLKASEGKMKAGKKEGIWIYWNQMGYPSKVEYYKNGNLNGKSIYYSTAADITENSVTDEIYETRLKRQKAFTENPDDWNLLLKNNFYLIEKTISYTDNKIDSVNIFEKNRFKEQRIYTSNDTSMYLLRTYKKASYKDSINFIIEEFTCKNGKKNGPYKKYNTKYDEVMSTGYYLNDKRDSIWVSEREGMKYISHYKQGDFHGLFATVFKGVYLDSSNYVNDRREGLCKTYRLDYNSYNSYNKYKDKDKSSDEDSYSEYKKKSKYKDTIWTYSNYTKGKLNGSKISYKNGRKTEISNYTKGDRDGEWIEYRDNGELKKKGYYRNDRKDSLWQEWNDKQQLKNVTLYRDRKIVKEEDYNSDGKLRMSFKKEPNGDYTRNTFYSDGKPKYTTISKGENFTDISYYPDGKKKRQTEFTKDKEVYTTWDEKGKKEVKVIDKKKKNYDEDAEVVEEVAMPAEVSKKYNLGDDDDEVESDSEYSYKNKYKKKKDEDMKYAKSSFPGGEKKQNAFLNLMTGNDSRDAAWAFFVQAAVTVSNQGEITFIKIESDSKRAKKKHLKEAEKIVLMMPKWEAARDLGKTKTENTGFNIWFADKK